MSTSRDPLQRDYRFNVAAYELDKALELDLVSPSVERAVNHRPAALTWWVDDVLIVRHFDEQIALKGERAVLYDLPVRR